jgi:hypothetical protein
MLPLSPHAGNVLPGNNTVAAIIMTCRRTMMLSTLLLWLACVSPALGIVCYIDIPGKPNQPPVKAAINNVVASDILCLRYQFVCKQGDSACSAEEVGTTRWAYGHTLQEACKAMKARADLYKSVTCCNTDKCNAPVAKMAPAASPAGYGP